MQYVLRSEPLRCRCFATSYLGPQEIRRLLGGPVDDDFFCLVMLLGVVFGQHEHFGSFVGNNLEGGIMLKGGQVTALQSTVNWSVGSAIA